MPRQKINCMEILRLSDAGMTQSCIAATLHASKLSVNNVLKEAKLRSLHYVDVCGLSNDELHNRLFSKQATTSANARCYPDLVRLHAALAFPGTTLRSEWNAFRTSCVRRGVESVGYSTFCNAYSSFVKEAHHPSHVTCKYGAISACTWLDQSFTPDGTTSPVYVFLGVLLASEQIYLEVTEAKDEDTFLRCISHMFKAFGGMTRNVIILHARRVGAKRISANETVVTDRLMGMRSYYGVDISLDREVEYVDHTADRLISAILQKGHCSLGTLFNLVAKFRDAENAGVEKSFKCEREYLCVMREPAYDVLSRHERPLTVQQNCHVKYRGNYYSAPYPYRGESISLQYTDMTVELLIDGAIIAVHDKFPAFSKHQYSTQGEHMPPKNQRAAFNKERYLRQAATFGPAVKEVVDRMFRRVQYEEQAYNTVQSLLHLRREAGPGRLQQACADALVTRRSPGYKYISEMLKNR